MTMMQDLMTEPRWLQAWVGWMMPMNTASLAFLKFREPRIVLASWIGNVITMTVMYEAFGYTRILGLSHVIWWTPLVIYLAVRFNRLETGSWVKRWVAVLIATNGLSLVIDYIDVVRYALGERDPMV